MSKHAALNPSSEMVALFVPLADDTERAIRARIHFARDQAQSRAERAASPESARIYTLAAQIAGEWVFRPDVPAETLAEVVTSLQSMFLIAARFDRIEKAAHGRG